MTKCGVKSESYWGDVYYSDHDKECQESNIIALADYTNGNTNLYFTGSNKFLPLMDQKVNTLSSITDDGNLWKQTKQANSIKDIPYGFQAFAEGKYLSNLDVYVPNPPDYSRMNAIFNGYSHAFVSSVPSCPEDDGWNSCNYL